jgi:hypothetical protein
MKFDIGDFLMTICQALPNFVKIRPKCLGVGDILLLPAT